MPNVAPQHAAKNGADSRWPGQTQNPRFNMWKRLQLGLLLSLAAAASMWLYVQRVMIPYQQGDAQVKQRPRGNLSDLYPRWLGARELLLHRRDPYSADITREIQAGYYGRPLDSTRVNDPKDQQGFAYPLYVVFLLAPTVGFPFVMVQKAFLLLLIALTAASVLLWLSAAGKRVSLTTALMAIVLVLGSFPAIQGFKLQQLTLLVAALVAVAIFAITRERLVAAGILFALASIKPQLVFLLVVWLGIWVWGNWRERQRLFWSFAVSFTVLVAGAELLLPGWMREFRRASAAYYRYTGSGQSVLDIALTPFVGKAVAAVLVVTLLVLVWRLRHAAAQALEFHWSLALVLATTLVVIPMFAPYNQVLLVPPVILIVGKTHELWQSGRVLRFLIVAAAVSVIWEWLAAGALVIATAFLPGAIVQKGWAAPFYTSLAIPVTVLAVLLAGRGANFRNSTTASIGK